MSETPLSEFLRQSTRTAHERVRALPLLRAFFRGRLDKRVVMEGLAALECVYSALETELRKRDALSAMAPPELRRTSSLRRDLEVLSDSGWPTPTGPMSAATAYADRIRAAAEEDPQLLVGHAYSRYMGDLFGGPIARRVAPLVLPTPRGFRLAYLEHRDIHDTRAYRTAYRATVDGAPVTDRDGVAEEALTAFGLHSGMVQQIWDGFVEPSSRTAGSTEARAEQSS